MSELSRNIVRQKRAGYVMIAGAVGILLGGVTAVQYYALPPTFVVGALVPVVILTAFGYRAVSASRNRRALGDERTVELLGKVSINAFWWLIGIIMLNSTFDVFPEEGADTLYLLSGMAVYALYYVYYRYID